MRKSSSHDSLWDEIVPRNAPSPAEMRAYARARREEAIKAAQASSAWAACRDVR